MATATICLHVCVQEWRNVNSRHCNWFVISVVNVYMFCCCVCFFLLTWHFPPTASLNLSQLPLVHIRVHNSPSTALPPANVHARTKQGQKGENQACITRRKTQRNSDTNECQRLNFVMEIKIRFICAPHVVMSAGACGPALLQSAWRDLRAFYLS